MKPRLLTGRCLHGAGVTLFALSVWTVCTSTRAASNQAEALQIKRGTDQFEMVYRAKLPALTGQAKLWLPLARSDAYQTVKVKTLSIPAGWELVEDKANRNRIVLLEPTPENSGGLIEISYEVRRKEKQPYEADDTNLAKYLRPDRLVPEHRVFSDMAREAVGNKTSVMDRARALYDHTLDRMKYDKSGTGWGRGDALYACDARAGNCTDFHAYFIALCRAQGIPARFAIGFTIPADQDAGVIGGYHCWAEFQADGRWVPVDISEADKFPGLAGYYFGHHPANRFEFTTGRDLVVDPLPATGPINFLVYPLLEVNGTLLNTENEFTFKRL